MFIPFKVKLIKPDEYYHTGIGSTIRINKGTKIGFVKNYYPTEEQFDNIYTVVAIEDNYGLLYLENNEPFWWPLSFTLGVK